MTETKTKVAGYKGFGLDMKCLGFQFEVGKTYTHAGAVNVCNAGFHAVEMPLDAFSYYAPGRSVYGLVSSHGDISHGGDGDTKFATGKITIEAALKMPEVISKAVAWVMQKVSATTGDRAHSATTGDSAHSATTGKWAHSATTGNRAHSATTGDRAHSATTGYSANSATTGDRAHSATTGDSAHSATTGNSAIAAALGIESTAAAGEGGWIVLAAWEWDGERYALQNVRTAQVGGPEGIKPNTKYRLNEAGDFEVVS